MAASFVAGAIITAINGSVKPKELTTEEIEAARQDSISKIKAGAYLAAKQLINRRLKSPSTAKYANYGYGENPAIVEFYEDGTYRVKIWVDAQNSFGAMLRNTYQVDMKRVGDNWKLQNIAQLK